VIVIIIGDRNGPERTDDTYFSMMRNVRGMADYVTTDCDDRFATVTIDRPEKLHALDADVLAGLINAFESLPREVCVVVLRTTGDDVFVAGADMDEFRRVDNRDEFLAFQELEREANHTIADHPAVVVAAVDGVAYGGGFELAVSADLLVASESAEFAFPEVRRGLIPGATGGAQWLPRLVGLPKAIELIATGEPVSAAEAQRLGLVNRVVSDDAVEDAARDLADSLLENAPLAVKAAKRVCRASAYDDLETIYSFGTELTGNLYETDDAQEGVDAFFEDRDPEFEGR
jgi:enoyl-CoA hydratase